MLMCVAGNKQMRNAQTPTVFFSGALHGDERVGTTATTGFSFSPQKSVPCYIYCIKSLYSETFERHGDERVGTKATTGIHTHA
jgi:hypothetical protein